MYLSKHEMHMLLLLEMLTGMLGPCMGSWQCMYQSNIYIDTSRPVLHLYKCYVKIHNEFL